MIHEDCKSGGTEALQMSRTLMSASTIVQEHSPKRPQNSQKSYSFTRLDSPRSIASSRSRASTLQDEASHPILTASPLEENLKLASDDIFENDVHEWGSQATVKGVGGLDSPQDVPADFDELPIELVSLIDRYEPVCACLR